MRPKVERIAEKLSAVMSAWKSVECVSLCEQAEGDVLDPYFALVLDVYHRGPVPAAEERRASFGDPGAFESAQAQPKDRFFLEGLPIRIEYKRVEGFEEFMDRETELLWILKNSGTYMFYRVENAKVLFSRSGWIDAVRKRILTLPDTFWGDLRESFQLKMEHHLADLAAAVLQDDGFFCLVSSAGFARYAASVIFILNHRFEPSHRLIEKHLLALPLLPEDFPGRWETLMRTDIEISRDQKYKVAELIAKSIVALQ
jgi:hypothetical protein